MCADVLHLASSRRPDRLADGWNGEALARLASSKPYASPALPDPLALAVGIVFERLE